MKTRWEEPEEKPKQNQAEGEGEQTETTEQNEGNSEEASEDHYSIGGDNGL